MCSCAFYCCTACFHISKLSSNTAYRVHFHCITTSPASILISRLNKLLERITTAHPSSHHKTILMIPMILFLTSFICLHCCCWASRIYVYWNCCLQQHFILLSCLLLYAVNSVDSICIVLVPIIGRNSSSCSSPDGPTLYLRTCTWRLAWQADRVEKTLSSMMSYRITSHIFIIMFYMHASHLQSFP